MIKYRLAACSDPAGKETDVAPLFGNEDNMLILPDLKPEAFAPDEVMDLGPRGTLLMVADGMGGMNAGEVASQIAVSTVQALFSSEEAAAVDASSYSARELFLEKAVVAADAAIKAKAAAEPECAGMGSTIIMIWLCGGEATVTWCGDSRAYLYRPSIGLRQVSKDHSYVQSLVDAGKITPDEAFAHPYGNVITRSLGDPSKEAQADSRTFPVYQGDILMLCSDGLSGVLRDSVMQDIIAESKDTLTGCREALWAAAKEAEWYDNVTAVLCEIIESDAEAPVVQPAPAPKPAPAPAPAPAPQPAPAPKAAPAPQAPRPRQTPPPTMFAPASPEAPARPVRLARPAAKAGKGGKKFIIMILAAFLIICGALAFIMLRKPSESNPPETVTTPQGNKPETKPENKPANKPANKPDNKPTNTVQQQDVKPQETKPQDVKPEEVKPQGGKPEEVKPQEVKPEEVKPAEERPDSTESEEIYENA